MTLPQAQRKVEGEGEGGCGCRWNFTQMITKWNCWHCFRGIASEGGRRSAERTSISDRKLKTPGCIILENVHTWILFSLKMMMFFLFLLTSNGDLIYIYREREECLPVCSLCIQSLGELASPNFPGSSPRSMEKLRGLVPFKWARCSKGLLENWRELSLILRLFISYCYFFTLDVSVDCRGGYQQQ